MMKHLKKGKKNNFKVTAPITLLILATTIILAANIGSIGVVYGFEGQRDNSFIDETTQLRSPRAPSVVSGDNIYIAWWTNNTENGNQEVMFRASTDGGATFGDKINLSNTTDADSWRVEIGGEGDTVIVSWWETNQTSDIPVARISTDAGETFGPLMMLAANGTLGSGEAEEIGVAAGGEGGETTTEEEEAVGGAEVAE
jgi:hypothetical protein